MMALIIAIPGKSMQHLFPDTSLQAHCFSLLFCVIITTLFYRACFADYCIHPLVYMPYEALMMNSFKINFWVQMLCKFCFLIYFSYPLPPFFFPEVKIDFVPREGKTSSHYL